jgi:hypothetical protein
MVVTRAATECERTAEEMLVRFKDTSRIYFRFSVDEGMRDIGTADWQRMSNAVGHARSYLRLPENDSKMTEFVQALKSKRNVVPTAHLSKFLPHSASIDI